MQMILDVKKTRNMFAFLSLLFSLTLSVTFGTTCTNLSGRWLNELGSVMDIQQEGNSITGSYQTAVESRREAAKVNSNVTGSVHMVKDGSLLGFTVLWNHGASVTAWVGQCYVCNGKEVISTTYNLHRHFSKPMDSWQANTVNQNTFWRTSNESNDVRPRSFEAQQSLNTELRSDSSGSFRGIRIQKMSGEWTSKNGDIIEFEVGKQTNLLQGKYKTVGVIAQVDGNEEFTAVGAVATYPKMVKVWTGYIDEKSPSLKNQLDATWLQHTFNPSCDEPQQFVQFGMTKYSRASKDERFSPAGSSTILEKIKKFFKSLF